jgi:hypothetical protein
MTLHFAAARSTARSPIARALARRAPGPAANDNGTAPSDFCPVSDRTLHAALRHFAAHGLGAARAAQAEAERALAANDRHGYDRWLSVCRVLDRRLAGQVAKRNAPLLGEPARPAR